MNQNKIVVRYSDGRLQKGTTMDFIPGKDSFHFMPADGVLPEKKLMEIRCDRLKAVFFVRDLDGNPRYKDKNEFEPGKPIIGRKIQVLFKDGERLVGTTYAYQPGRSGFFIAPADPHSNIERCFVVTGATRLVTLM